MACQAGEFSSCLLSRFASLASRGSIAKTSYFLETISYPVLILGESGDSGRNSAFGWTRKEADSPERISGRVERSVPDSRSGLKIGDFAMFLLP